MNELDLYEVELNYWIVILLYYIIKKKRESVHFLSLFHELIEWSRSHRPEKSLCWQSTTIIRIETWTNKICLEENLLINIYFILS